MTTNYSSIGKDNLKTIAAAKNFTAWLYSEIKPFIKGPILEIGSGLGTYSQKISNDFPFSQITLSEIDPKFMIKLKQTFKTRENVSVVKLDLNRKNDFVSLKRKFNTILLINVLEHIQQDQEALENLVKLLKPNGQIILLVPAHQFLFNRIDEAVGHFRRYNLATIKNLSSNVNLIVKKTFYFNCLSILAWYINGTILQRSLISQNALGFYDKIVPLLKFIEKYLFQKRLGISLIVILKK